MSKKRIAPKTKEFQHLLPQAEIFRRIDQLNCEGGTIKDDDQLAPDEVAEYCDVKVKGGLRDACLAVDLAIRSGRDFELAVRQSLLEKWKEQMVYDIFNVGRNIIPWLRKRGLLSYRDPFNLRQQMKVLKNAAHSAHIDLVNAIERNAPQKELRQLCLSHQESGNSEPYLEDRQLPSAVGRKFETFVERLLIEMYPEYSWSHLGRTKSEERGLDFFGSPFNVTQSQDTLGVQVKCHKSTATPSEQEWLKFLAGCFTRRVRYAIFITTGRLTGNQYREAQEAQIITVIDGLAKINKLATKHQLPPFTITVE